MDSIDDLRNNISEIDVLIECARRREHGSVKAYQLFNKVSIVLLATKFETFIEHFIDEHSQRILNGHTNKTISPELKDEYFESAIELISNEKKKSEKKALFKSLYNLFSDNENSISDIMNICPSRKFNYGRHGQKEIEKLFARHGLGGFIKGEEVRNCVTLMNSLISIRNNVIHEDCTPSLTHQIVLQHKRNIIKFAELLEKDIEKNKKEYYNE